MNRLMRSLLLAVAPCMVLSPEALRAQGTRYVYVAPVYSPWGGSGSATDPYDATTVQKFDTVMSNLLARVTTNLVINLMPGTYWTRGSDAGTNGWRVAPGSAAVLIRGQGEGSTFLNLTNVPATAPRTAIQFGRPGGTPTRGCAVAWLTVDAGTYVAGVGNGSTLGIALYGTSNFVEHVTVRNLRSSQGGEAVGILLASTNTGATDCRVEWASVLGLRDANATGLRVVSDRARVANCTVDFGPVTGADTRTTAGLTVVGSDCLVMANTVTNAQWGVRSGTGARTNLLANNVFFANSFQGQQAAFSWLVPSPTNTCPAWLFSENTFHAPRPTNYWLEAWCPTAPVATNTHPGWKLVRNQFIGLSTNGLAHRDGADWVYLYNRFDREPRNIFGGRRISQFNQTTNGSAVLSVP